MTPISKKLHYHEYFTTNSNDMKKTWEGINKHKGKCTIKSIKRPNKNGISSIPTEIANILNQHFASIGEKLS